MPKLKPKTEKRRAQALTNLYIKKGRNKAAVGRQEGVSRQAIYDRMKRKPVQQTLDEHIQKVAKRVGINLTWLLKKYKDGADNAESIIGYLHQYKKEKNGQVEKAKPNEAVSNDFITTKDWKTQRNYMRDIAEIMKWIKQNGKNDGKGSTSITIVIDRRPANSDSDSRIHISRIPVAK